MSQALAPVMDPAFRERITALEDSIRAELPLVELPVQHFFIPGCYARALYLPAGTVATGKIHKHPQISILAQGDISVLTEDGMRRVQAPFVLVSPPGVKRAVYAHTDSTWITVHRTDETDVEKVEAELVATSFAEYDEFVRLTSQEAPCLSQQ